MKNLIPKIIEWVGSSKNDYSDFPEDVKDDMGFSLYEAQMGNKSRTAKPLKGFGSASVLELVENNDGDTYRAVYTVKFAGVLYILHAFQKKSKHGKETPKQEIDKIKERLTRAEEHYQEYYRRKGS